jgi:trimeric autotransporter adhesin
MLLYTNTTGVNNTAVGFDALGDNIGGTSHVAVGYKALAQESNAIGNTAVGFEALTASNRAAVDANAYNTAVGWKSLTTTGTSQYNTAVGAGSLQVTTSGSNNTAMGYNALTANTTGASNTAVGYQALDANETGVENTAVGKDAAPVITTGSFNTCLGSFAGNNLTTGSSNTYVGYNSIASGAGVSGEIAIGAGNMTAQGGGYVTIGNQFAKVYNQYSVNATWTQSSDQRLKKNIQDDTLGLSFINRLRPVKYEWKASNELDKDNPYYFEENKRATGIVMHGLIAQEVKAALDAEGVTTFAGWDVGPDTIQAISREMFVSPLIKAIQELSAQVTALQAEVNTLKGN